jgi:hypothetical protein
LIENPAKHAARCAIRINESIRGDQTSRISADERVRPRDADVPAAEDQQALVRKQWIQEHVVLLGQRSGAAGGRVPSGRLPGVLADGGRDRGVQGIALFLEKGRADRTLQRLHQERPLAALQLLQGKAVRRAVLDAFDEEPAGASANHLTCCNFDRAPATCVAGFPGDQGCRESLFPCAAKKTRYPDFGTIIAIWLQGAGQ